jgi:NAD(P)-dependent dehydrogenase (short-subunit alcohol dehydrogenase family)
MNPNQQFASYPSLQGRLVLITGGASGIGWAVALRLRAEGARVCVGDLSGRAQGACLDNPGMSALELDVTDEASVAAATQHVDLGSLLRDEDGLALR